MAYISDTKALQPYSCHKNELTVQNGCILYGIKAVIPPKFQSRFHVLHETHPGKVRMKSLARASQRFHSHFAWVCLMKDARALDFTCGGHY